MHGEWDVSIWCACRILEVDTSTCHYRSHRPNQAGLEGRIKEICATRVRCPKTVGVDHGSEFVSRDLDFWAYTKRATLDF